MYQLHGAHPNLCQSVHIMTWSLTYRRSREVQSSPLSPVVPFSQKLLRFSPHHPCFQSFLIFCEFGLIKVPHHSTPTIPTDPLAIKINVYPHIEASLDVYCQV